MDNASKALIMAGGILIAVLVIGVSIYVINSARGVAKVSNERLEANAIQSFNRFYTSYGNDVSISGVDALNIYRKAQDDNEREARIHPVDTLDVVSEIKDLSNNIDAGTVDVGSTDCANVFKSTYTFSYETDFDGYIYVIHITY